MAKKTPFQRAEFRAERLLRDREAIRVLREHFTGYEARDGYSLDVRKIAKLTASQRRYLRKKYTKVATLLSQPHDLVKPKDKKEARALRHFTQERFQRMKHFIVHKPDKQSKVTIEKGAVTLTRKFPGKAKFKEQFFMFPRRARGPGDMVKMLEEMLPDMPKGMYVIQSTMYGDTGEIADKGQLVNRLRGYLAAYDKPKYGEHRFLYQVLGFRFMSTTLKGAEVQQSARDERRQGQREYNRERRDALEREARRLARCKVRRGRQQCILQEGHTGEHRFRKT